MSAYLQNLPYESIGNCCYCPPAARYVGTVSQWVNRPDDILDKGLPKRIPTKVLSRRWSVIHVEESQEPLEIRR